MPLRIDISISPVGTNLWFSWDEVFGKPLDRRSFLVAMNSGYTADRRCGHREYLHYVEGSFMGSRLGGDVIKIDVDEPNGNLGIGVCCLILAWRGDVPIKENTTARYHGGVWPGRWEYLGAFHMLTLLAGRQ